MKKLFIILFTAIIMLLIPGCKEEDYSAEESIYLAVEASKDLNIAAIEDWRSREQQIPYSDSEYFDESFAMMKYRYCQRAFSYNYDKFNNHDRTIQTYLETESYRTAICSDYAVWLYIELKRYGFGDRSMAVIMFSPTIGSGHTMLCKLEDPNDIDSFRMIDSRSIHPVGECPAGMRAVLGFNLFDTWEYD